jgi:GldM C-terminal domain
MKYCFLFISVLFSSLSHGQVDIINQSLTDSSINIFYIGVDNAIKLKTAKSESEYNIVIKGTATIFHEGGKNYIVRVSSVVDNCIVDVYDKAGKKVLERSYKTRTIAPPIATLNGLKDTVMRISRILINPLIRVIFPECYFRFNYKVTSFHATFIQGEDSTTTVAKDNVLSTEQIQILKTLQTGNKIYFDNIRTVGPDGRGQKLQPFWIRIE